MSFDGFFTLHKLLVDIIHFNPLLTVSAMDIYIPILMNCNDILAMFHYGLTTIIEYLWGFCQLFLSDPITTLQYLASLKYAPQYLQ